MGFLRGEKSRLFLLVSIGCFYLGFLLFGIAGAGHADDRQRPRVLFFRLYFDGAGHADDFQHPRPVHYWELRTLGAGHADVRPRYYHWHLARANAWCVEWAGFYYFHPASSFDRYYLAFWIDAEYGPFRRGRD